MISRLLSQLGGTHLHIAKNMFLVGVFVFIGKIAGAAREIVIANEYGVSPVVDQFVLVSTFALLIPTVWTAVAVSVLVPVSRRMSVADRSEFHSQLSSVVLVIAIVLSVLFPLYMPSLLSLFYPALSGSENNLLKAFSYGLAPLAGFGLIIGLFNAQLLTLEKHANTLFEGVPALVVMLFILFWPGTALLAPLIVGSIVGAVLHFLVLGRLLAKSSALALPQWNFQSPAWRGFRAAIGIMVVGKIIMSFIGPLEQVIAGSLGTGAIATLNYANKLIALPLGLGATAVGRAILPVLSGPVSEQRKMLKVASQWSLALFVFGLLLTGVAWLLTEWGVRLLFERGAFTAENTQSVAAVTQAGLLQLPFFFASIVLVQLFASRGQYWILFYTSVAALIVKGISSYVLSFYYGIAGVAMGTSVMYAVNCLILLFMLFLVNKQQS